MEADNKALLLEQIEKLNSVLNVLNNQFSSLEIEDEINFLSVVKDNLQNLVEE